VERARKDADAGFPAGQTGALGGGNHEIAESASSRAAADRGPFTRR